MHMRRLRIAITKVLAIIFMLPFIYISFRKHFYMNHEDEGVGVDACAVESAAHHHPHRPVLLLVTAPAILHPQPLLQIVEDLENVELAYLDLDQVFSEPPLKSWHIQRLWLYNEEFTSVFISDAARAELLRRFGGTYLDLDVLTLRPLPDLQPYLGRYNTDMVNNHVLSFPPRHPFIQVGIMTKPEVHVDLQLYVFQ
nr:lactosylceramide 4-alpha-galactosyltransferase-like [Cherax quadricarinatus]